MSDYQAIYDAVRSRIRNGDIGQSVSDAIREANVAYYAQVVADNISYEAAKVAQAHAAPSAVYRPSLRKDGNQWCAIYGENVQEGVCGFGDTPAAAMAAFDKAWSEQ